jgi:hypothetical protein
MTIMFSFNGGIFCNGFLQEKKMGQRNRTAANGVTYLSKEQLIL